MTELPEAVPSPPDERVGGCLIRRDGGRVLHETSTLPLIQSGPNNRVKNKTSELEMARPVSRHPLGLILGSVVRNSVMPHQQIEDFYNAVSDVW